MLGDGGKQPVGTLTALVEIKRPSNAVLLKQLDYVIGWSDLRSDRAREIVSQMTYQFPFWGSIVPLRSGRTSFTLELLRVALRLASFAAQRFKHALCVRRPHEYSPQVQPMIQTPGHGSFPSGHSTQAFAVARLLIDLIPQPVAAAPPNPLVQQLMAQAARIAINRTVAGVHFPIDSLVGQVLGLATAEYLIARCKPEVDPTPSLSAPPALSIVDAWSFNGDDNTIGDFSGGEFYDVTTASDVAGQTFATKTAGAVKVNGSNLLNWLWRNAALEW